MDGSQSVGQVPGQVAVHVHGSTTKPVVILLHGFLGSSQDWEFLVEAFEEKYCLVTVDLPGHGASIQLEESAYTLSGAVTALQQRFDDLALPASTLVGYSMGGRIAMHLALNHTPRYRGLVLESAHPGMIDPMERAKRRMIDDQRAQSIRADWSSFLGHWYREPLFASLDRQPGLRERLIADRLSGQSHEIARALTGLGAGNQLPLGERLGTLRVPVLLLSGEHDERYKTITGELHARLSCGDRLIIADAGHNVHLEQPRLFAEALRSFLERTTTDLPCP